MPRCRSEQIAQSYDATRSQIKHLAIMAWLPGSKCVIGQQPEVRSLHDFIGFAF